MVAHDDSVPVDGSGVRAAGYGRPSLNWPTAADGGAPPGLAVDLLAVGIADCAAQWEAAPAGGGNENPGADSASALNPFMHVCAGVDAGGCDTCQGDSGGPLYQILRGSEGEDGGDGVPDTYVLVGVTSFSPGCAAPRTPTAYTRVAAYVGWVDTVVGSGTGPLLADGSRVGGPLDETIYPTAPSPLGIDGSLILRRVLSTLGVIGGFVAVLGSVRATFVLVRRRRAAAGEEGAPEVDAAAQREGADAAIAV